MKISLLLSILGLLILMLVGNQWNLFNLQPALQVGGLPLYGWLGTIGLACLLGLYFAHRATELARRLLEKTPTEDPRLKQLKEKISRAIERGAGDALNGPDYPRPVIIENDCIACDACVEACPHDVLSMLPKMDGKGFVASVVRSDLCMEDTSCEAICPTNACVVINTTKEIIRPPRPRRDEKFMTDVTGCYIIGAVSEAQLIKTAIKEGADVIEHIAEELPRAPKESKVRLDVAVIGIGPGGLSAVLAAKKRNMSFLGLEQDKVLSTINAYAKEKFVQLKPEEMQTRSVIQITSAGEQRETILESWTKIIHENEIGIVHDGDELTEPVNVIIENERCMKVSRAPDGDYFIIDTIRGAKKERQSYTARRVILAIGLRGSPMKLGGPGGKLVKGEDLKIRRNGEPVDKVMNKLLDPEDFRKCKVIVVGGGNSAIETAVDLVARRIKDQIEFLPPDQINEVTLLVRSDFTHDVKFGNKQQIYKCIDEGKIKILFGKTITEIQERVVIIKDQKTHGEERLENDYVFAMIGGERPVKFLTDAGIYVPEK